MGDLSRGPALCQSCGEQGNRRPHAEVLASGVGREPWCKCPAKRLGGPYVNPPGVVVRMIFETADAASFREKCRLAGNSLIEARDNLSSRFVRCGKGWRELPRGNAKRERIERAYWLAKRAHEKLQRGCPHTHRSMYDERACDVCHLVIEREVICD